MPAPTSRLHLYKSIPSLSMSTLTHSNARDLPPRTYINPTFVDLPSISAFGFAPTPTLAGIASQPVIQPSLGVDKNGLMV
jgi:hypothetical protein